MITNNESIKQYRATLTQNSTDPPTVIKTHLNTLGYTPTWLYDGVGLFYTQSNIIKATNTFVQLTMGVGVGFPRIIQGGIDAGQDGLIVIKTYAVDGNAANLGGAEFQVAIDIYETYQN